MIEPRRLELLEEQLERGDEAALAAMLSAWTVPDVLRIWGRFSESEHLKLFRLLPARLRPLLLADLAVEEQECLIRNLSVQVTGDLLALMDPDDLVDLIQQVSGPIRQAVLDSLPESSRVECEFLLSFDSNDAAGLMTSRYAALRPMISVGQALLFLRNQQRLEKLEVISSLYVLDPLKRLCGVLSIKHLLAAADSQLISEVMNPHCVTVHANADHHEVASTLVEHDLIAVPIVDEQQRMLGVVTFDDVFDVLDRKEKRSVYRMSGVQANTRGFFASSAGALVLRRAPWLLVLLALGAFTTNVLVAQQQMLRDFAFLALFIPVITQTGGNVGGQSATLLIRDLLLVERVDWQIWLRVLGKELLVGLSLGLIVGVFMSARLLWLPPTLDWRHLSVVVLALMGVVLGASLLGTLIPLLLRMLRLDPAVAAGPVMSTLVDLLGLSFYFTIASWLLR